MSTRLSIPHISEDQLVKEPLFRLECSLCGRDVLVTAHTERFREVGRGPMTAYYGLLSGSSTLAGISDGNATNFECLRCHSKKWAEDFLS